MSAAVSFRELSVNFFKSLQLSICRAIEQSDQIDGHPQIKFNSDNWQRGTSGGGGISNVLSNGNIFEQAGVNFSEVYGELPEDMCEKLIGLKQVRPFYATGVSLVIHPISPLVPTTHANFRYLEVDNLAWFGGGMDLTPYYLFEQDAIDFHSVLKKACDQSNPDYYPKFKAWCDQYFYLPHRGETRGIGGLFFDYLGKEDPQQLTEIFEFIKQVGQSFLPAYMPIVERRKNLTWTETQKNFQLIRRGRYVEFNLLYDRGTLFGLKTGGRVESILMSLPPNVKWSYNFQPSPNSPEAELLETLKNPREWL